MKNAVQYNYRSNCWMVLTPERGVLGSAMKERDAKLFAMSQEMFDLLKDICSAGDNADVYGHICRAENIIHQIEPILSINNQEGEF